MSKAEKIKLRAELVARDRKAIWHPYTQMSEYRSQAQPLVIERAEGSRLYDLDGRSIIDGNASWWTALLGHGHPRLTAALQKQSQTMSHISLAGITHEPAIRLSENLLKHAPAGISQVFFSDNGSTAVEAGLKMAIQFFQQQPGKAKKQKFLALKDAFHGETMGVTALGGVAAFIEPFQNHVMPVTHLPSPADGEELALDALEKTLLDSADDYAALVIEPLIQGAGGMRMYSPAFIDRASELCVQHDVLFIVDEVFTGYGRTGRFWALDYTSAKADIVCSAKGLSGGMLPFAVTLTNERVFSGFLGDKSRAFMYGHTYCGNPLGAAVAAEVLSIYQDEQIVAGTAKRSAMIAKAFSELGELEGVENARALGMCGALNLGNSRDYLQSTGWRVYEEALRHGAYMRPLGNVVYVTPPLNISLEDLGQLLNAMTASVKSVLNSKN